MEQQKKRYKATKTEDYGPFEGWMIEELDPEEYAKEEAKEKEFAAKNPGKLSAAELKQKRKEQISSIWLKGHLTWSRAKSKKQQIY